MRRRPKEWDPALDRLLDDWHINKELPGSDHPALKELLEEMSRVRQMSDKETDRLKNRIADLQKEDRNFASIVGTLHNRIGRAITDPYLFPRVLSDRELKFYIEQASYMRDVGKGAAELPAPVVGKKPTPADVGAAMVQFGGKIGENHYARRVRMYEAEIERRAKERDERNR
jgi:hypothetical protein